MLAKPDRAESILGLPLRDVRWNIAIHLTPEKAKRLLEEQPSQRPIQQRHVENLSDQMTRGKWRQTTEGLAFDESGMMFDGQHRCWACFTSGTTIPIMAFFNEPRANVRISGIMVRPRTMAQMLIVDGVETDPRAASTTSAAARFAWAYDAGKNPVAAHTYRGFDPEVQAEVLRRHPFIGSVVRDIMAKRNKMLVPSSHLAAVLGLASETADAKAAIFLHQVISGQGLSAGDPALTLRDRALRGSGGRYDMAYAVARAWNAFYEGRALLKVFGANAANGQAVRTLDAFPTIAGYTRP